MNERGHAALRARKIRRLIKDCRMLPFQAAEHWDKTRIYDGSRKKRRKRKRRAT